MSAICGIVDLDGGEVSHREIQPMWDALSSFGPDGGAILVDGAAGFGFQSMRVTPEPDCGVWRDAAAGVLIAADARLDNRDDLAAALSIAAMDLVARSDTQLIVSAYLKWGEGCADRLVGDFVFAIWDSTRQRLFCARDHFGVRQFYHRLEGRRFVFASQISAVLACHGAVPRPNLRRLATMGMPGAFLVDNESTFFAGVSSLPPATTLTAGRSPLRTARYWIPDASATLPVTREADIFDALGELVERAVAARVRSATPVAALLSGGLDSSSVVGTAAQVLERRGHRLTTLSAVVPDGADTQGVDERAWIDCFRSWPGVDSEYVTDPARGPFDAVDEVVRAAETPLVMSRHYLYSAFAARARERGARVVLDGAFGEMSISRHPEGYYAELFAGLRWVTFIRAISLKRRRGGLSIAEDVLRYLIPASILSRLRRAPKHETWTFSSPLRRDFVRRELSGDLSRFENAVDAVQRNRACEHVNHHALVATVARKSRDLKPFAGRHTVDVRFPLLDKRLVEYCLAVPSELKVRDGYHRYLARAALADRLPPKIRWRTSKAPFSPDYHRRYDAQRTAAHALLAAIAPNDPIREVVDVGRIAPFAAHDVNTPDASPLSKLAAMHLVPFGVYTVAFLRQFPEFRP